MRPVEGRSHLDRAKTERLIALLHAQHDEAEHRSGLTRDTSAWSESRSRLDDLNDQIMHMGAHGSTIRDAIGDGMELDLDSRPVEDAPFRREVVGMVRRAVAVVVAERLARPSLARLGARVGRPGRTRDLMAAAELALRAHYPNATIAAFVATRADTLTIRADRDGRGA